MLGWRKVARETVQRGLQELEAIPGKRERNFTPEQRNGTAFGDSTGKGKRLRPAPVTASDAQ